MFDKLFDTLFGGFKRYKDEVSTDVDSDLRKSISAVRYWIFTYALALIIWHGIISFLFEDWAVTLILLIYIVNPIVWFFLGFTFATENKYGHNLFIIICAVIFALILLGIGILDSNRYFEVWYPNQLAVFAYIVTAKIGTKFAS